MADNAQNIDITLCCLLLLPESILLLAVMTSALSTMSARESE